LVKLKDVDAAAVTSVEKAAIGVVPCAVKDICDTVAGAAGKAASGVVTGAENANDGVAAAAEEVVDSAGLVTLNENDDVAIGPVATVVSNVKVGMTSVDTVGTVPFVNANAVIEDCMFNPEALLGLYPGQAATAGAAVAPAATVVSYVGNANAAVAVDVGPDELVRKPALAKSFPTGGLVTPVLVGAVARAARAGAGAAGRGGGTIGDPGCSSVPAPFFSRKVWLAGTGAAAGAENDASDHSPATGAGEAARVSV
jgi:hypothetical protein